ncbi:adenylate/guanylate cyclase domain-containing protein [Breoghania sp.]|uniref:adenylate/guanylate cyclase domain-containing protein n=1 Tax=Breoghania sp. TaxID=2065378 RepID=UPI002AA5FACB|nr:adenylate/guanylate cyclase domain-containing protein [Breoghania sp.]
MGWRPWPRKGRGKIPIVLIAGGTYALLITLAMGLVLYMTGKANFQNTFALLNDKAVLMTNQLEAGLRTRLDPLKAAVGAMQGLYADSRMEIEDNEAVRTILAASLFSVPAAEGLIISQGTRGQFGVVKSAEGKPTYLPWHEENNHFKGPYGAPKIEADSAPIWGPMVSNQFGIFANVSAPLSRNGTLDAVLTATLSMDGLSEIVEALDTGDGTAFIVSANGRVIAYSDLASLDEKGEAGGEGNGNGNGLRPDGWRLPRPIVHFGDPVLAKLLDTPTMAPFAAAREAGVDVREIDTGDGEFIAMSRRVSGYGPVDWVVGVYFQNSTVSNEIHRLIGSLLIGIAAIVVTIILSFFVASRLTRPLAKIVSQSRKVADLEFDKVERLPDSPVREVDEVLQAFNSMAAGLGSLNTYVPKTLFRKLMRMGVEEATRSREIELTIVFTDIAGFTHQSEGMSAGEAAAFLNAHFAIMVEAVEAEMGTVDKFMGDGMLAFWGAPDAREDHAEAAVRAARAMQLAVHAANESLAAQGRAPTHVRIGIHTGPVIVGNIGALDRVDYTIVGDAVNVSQRLQDLGRCAGDDSDVVILTSAGTLRLLSPDVPRSHFGHHQLRGREADVDVWRLYPEKALAEGEEGVT